MTMKKRTGLLLLALVSLLAIPLALAFRNVARDEIVIPLMYFLWQVGIFLRGFDALLWWVAFLVAAVFLFWRSLGRVARPTSRLHTGEPVTTGRVAFWATQIEKANRSGYVRWQLQRDLAHIALEMVAHGQQASVSRSGQETDIEELGAPPDVHAFLRAGLDRPDSSSTGIFARWTSRSRRDKQVSPPHSDLERVVEFMEDRVSR
jgi:membrane protein implicated in regulation of membrane protease activity